MNAVTDTKLFSCLPEKEIWSPTEVPQINFGPLKKKKNIPILILHLANSEARAEEDEAWVSGFSLLYSHFHT